MSASAESGVSLARAGLDLVSTVLSYNPISVLMHRHLENTARSWPDELARKEQRLKNLLSTVEESRRRLESLRIPAEILEVLDRSSRPIGGMGSDGTLDEHLVELQNQTPRRWDWEGAVLAGIAGTGIALHMWKIASEVAKMTGGWSASSQSERVMVGET